MTTAACFVFDSPAVYQILVEGGVAPHWAEAVGSMTLCANQERGKALTTTLTGEVTDQAALLGVLTELYEMHCTVLEVKRLSESNTFRPHSSQPPASLPPEA